MCLTDRFGHARFPREKTAPLASVTTTWGSFLESPDNKRSRRAVVVDIRDRGINSFADDTIKLSARTRAFDLNIWFRARKVSVSFEKPFPYLFLALLVFSDTISCFKSKKTSIVGWLLLTLRRDRLVNTRSRYSGWRWRQWSKTIFSQSFPTTCSWWKKRRLTYLLKKTQWNNLLTNFFWYTVW